MSQNFFEKPVGKHVVWGEDDCSAWAAQWYYLKTGNRPDIPEYSTKEQAHQLIERAGGLVALWDRALLGFGLKRIGDPQSGDVGIINTTKFGPVGGIFGVSGLFYWRTEDNVAVLAARKKVIIEVWQT